MKKAGSDLFSAIMNFDFDWIENYSGRVDYQDGNGDNPLHLAILCFYKFSIGPKTHLDDLQRVLKRLIQLGADVNHRNKVRQAPLHRAVLEDSVAAEKILVKSGCEVDAQDRYGCTPLFLSVEHEFVDSVRFMVKNGADIMIPNNNRVTPLMLSNGIIHTSTREEIMDILARKVTNIFDLVAGGVIPYIQRYSGDFNVRNKDGDSPLHIAVEVGSPVNQGQLVWTLIDTNMDVDMRDRNGMTALVRAIASKKAKSATISSLTRVTDVNIPDLKLMTALHYAAIRPDVVMVHDLIKHRADVNAVNRAGMTPLDLVLELLKRNHSSEAEDVRDELIKRGGESMSEGIYIQYQ